MCVCVLPNSLCVQWQVVYDKCRALYTNQLTQLSPDNILRHRLMNHLFNASDHLHLWEEALEYSTELLGLIL